MGEIAAPTCILYLPAAAAWASMAATGRLDLEKFRLRRFVERLIALGEVEVHTAPVALSEISAVIEGSPKASLFKDVGPEHFEIVGAVGGSRRRYAAAFGDADERTLADEYAGR